MQLTLPQAAKLYGKHRSTLHRHIASGRLSCGFRGDGTRLIDMAELIRCYGEPKRLPDEMQPSATTRQADLQPAMLQALHAMHRELVALREEVAELRRLPAPSAQPKRAPASPPVDAEQEDPHGFRSLVQSLREQDHTAPRTSGR